MIAAICAAPTILESLGILKYKKVTCHPGFVKELVDAVYVDMPVIMEENIITGKNPAAAPYFTLKFVEIIKGEIEKGVGYLS
jgi:4-methyl-5(b-hydroxyethyl)-thiazole monophosphate biosynthesis